MGTHSIPPWIRLGADHLSIEIAARPGAAKTEIMRIDVRGPVVAIAAPAEQGKANDELLRFISKFLGVPRDAIAILSGASGRRKTLRIAAQQPASCLARLLAVGTRPS